MHISLTPELEEIIRSKVASGLYHNASEVVREALRFVALNEQWVDEVKLSLLRTKLRKGEQDVRKWMSSPQ
jgi:antitoxin ParD1/3/4